MKARKDQMDFIKSQSGSMVMQVLIVAIMLTIVAGSVMSYINRQNTVHTLRRVSDEVENFQTTLQMGLSHEGNCQKNLVAGSFGSTPADVTTLNKEIALHIGSSTYSAGSQFGAATVKSIHFSKSEKLTGMGTDYLNELTVQVYDSLDIPHAGVRTLVIPVYFGDAYPGDNTLDSCFVTSYVESPPVNAPPNHKMTAEDMLCTQFQLQNAREGGPIIYTQFPPPPMPVYIYKPSFAACKITP